MRNTIRLGKVFGIEVGLDYSWFIILILITWSLAGHYLDVYQAWTPEVRWGLALLTALLFFASVLAHEFGHSVVANAVGVPVRSITLFIFGGVAQITHEPRRALHEFLIAIAGPLVSFALAITFALAWAAGQFLGVRSLAAVGSWLSATNLSLAVFNLIPGYPLDGGRVLRAIVWGATGNRSGATRVVGVIGQVVAWLFILGGIVLVFNGDWADGLWIAFIGWFLNSAATSSVREVGLQESLKGHTAREVMITDCPCVPPNLTLEQLVHDTILATGRRYFPVIDDGRLLGLVTVHRIKEVPRDQWPLTTVTQVMIPVERLVKTQPDEELAEVMERMASEDVNQLPVIDAGGRWVGMVARNNILSFIRRPVELAA